MSFLFPSFFSHATTANHKDSILKSQTWCLIFLMTWYHEYQRIVGLPWWLRQQRICLQCRRCGFSPWVGKIPWRRERLPTPVFLPGESRGWRSPVGYSPWSRKELHTTEQLSTNVCACWVTSVMVIRSHFWSKWSIRKSCVGLSWENNVCQNSPGIN